MCILNKFHKFRVVVNVLYIFTLYSNKSKLCTVVNFVDHKKKLKSFDCHWISL